MAERDLRARRELNRRGLAAAALVAVTAIGGTAMALREPPFGVVLVYANAGRGGLHVARVEFAGARGASMPGALVAGGRKTMAWGSDGARPPAWVEVDWYSHFDDEAPDVWGEMERNGRFNRRRIDLRPLLTPELLAEAAAPIREPGVRFKSLRLDFRFVEDALAVSASIDRM